MYGVNPGALFTIKCVMQKNPMMFILTTYLISIPFFAWMLRIAERPFIRVEEGRGFDYANAMWNIIITMTTGEYFSSPAFLHINPSRIRRHLCQNFVGKRGYLLCLYLGHDGHLIDGRNASQHLQHEYPRDKSKCYIQRI